MNTYEYDRRGLFGNRWRPPVWLLPLALGIALGALIVGHLPGIWPAFDDHAGSRHRHGFYAPRFGQEADPRAGAVSPADQSDSPDRQGQRFHAHTAHDRGHDIFSWPGLHLFGPLAGLRLVVPLLLIGVGAWLLSRRHDGPGSGGRPRTWPTPPAVEEPPGDSDLPATGETRRL